MSSTGPGTRPPAPRPEPVADTTSVVPGTGILPLAGETVLTSLRRGATQATLAGEDIGLHLTSRRVIMFGQDRILLLFPSGRIVRSALVEDIDTAGVRTKRLPTWLFLAGLLLGIGGLLTLMAGGSDDSYSDSGSGNDGVATVIMLAGAGMALLWLLVRREAVVLSVAGTDHLEFYVFRRARGQVDEAAAFISAYYEQKDRLASPGSDRPEPG